MSVKRTMLPIAPLAVENQIVIFGILTTTTMNGPAATMLKMGTKPCGRECGWMMRKSRSSMG